MKPSKVGFSNLIISTRTRKIEKEISVFRNYMKSCMNAMNRLFLQNYLTNMAVAHI